MSVESLTAKQVSSPYKLFERQRDEGVLDFAAGFPGFPENFTRDSTTAGLVGGDSALLAAQQDISARHMGTRNDPSTGEVNGRVHHQIPGNTIQGRNGLFTTYNSCDATPLFVIGAAALAHLDPDMHSGFVRMHPHSIERATEHILSRVCDNNLYWEKPPQGSKGFSLRVTYWKDSILPHANGKKEPIYPVTYAQPHFVAARSLLAASALLGDPSLARIADQMFNAGIKQFVGPNSFTVYIDQEDSLQQASSDEMHSLAFIPRHYAGLLPLPAIKQRARSLATPYGYMCTPRHIAAMLQDTYHGDVVWPIDQAQIHYGSRKFGLNEEAQVASAVAGLINEGQELFGVRFHEDGSSTPEPRGNPRMLWSIAAAEYFKGKSPLARERWL